MNRRWQTALLVVGTIASGCSATKPAGPSPACAALSEAARKDCHATLGLPNNECCTEGLVCSGPLCDYGSRDSFVCGPTWDHRKAWTVVSQCEKLSRDTRSAEGDVMTADPAISGHVLLRALGEGLAFQVALSNTATVEDALPTLADGHCDVAVAGFGDSIVAQLVPGDLDLGAWVTATSGDLSLAAARETGSAGFLYFGTQAGVDAFGRTWTLTASGSPAVAAGVVTTVDTPSAVTPIVPAPGTGNLDTTLGPVNLQWTGGAGAQTIHIHLSSSKVDVDCYPSPATTLFRIPADIVPLLDKSVSAAIWAESFYTVTFAGRVLRVRVTADNLD